MFIYTAQYTLLMLVNFKYTLKPFLILILVIGGISAYAMDTYGYIISGIAYQSLFATDTNELRDLINYKLLLYVLFLVILPIIAILCLKLRYPSYKRHLLYLLVAMLLTVVNLSIFNKDYISFIRNHRPVRYLLNPAQPLYSLVKYTFQKFQKRQAVAFNILDTNPVMTASNDKPKLVILVIGESDRAINHSLNGYDRITNPLLSRRNDVFSFTQFYSCGTETSVSVPCMFSPFKREDFTNDKGLNTENVLDILQKSKVHVVWRDNDSGCKGVCDRVITEDFNNAKILPFCKDGECFDEILLHQLNKVVTKNTQDKLIVLHKKGNHGPAYYKRYPKKFTGFTPVCESSNLAKCSNEEIINTYDNIILYTDYFLDNIINQLQNVSTVYQTAMIYVSDHGESLGEHGMYLHAMPYWIAPQEQTHVPFIFWASEDFSIDRSRLKALQQQPLSHDNLFHSLLGLFKIQTTAYDSELDMFRF